MRKALSTASPKLKENQAGEEAVYRSEGYSDPEDGIDSLQAFGGSHESACRMIAARTTPPKKETRLIE